MDQVDRFQLTGSVLRAARALIEISAADLAREAGVGERTILRAEKVDGPVTMRASNSAALVATLEARGVTFLAANTTSGAGLRSAR